MDIGDGSLKTSLFNLRSNSSRVNQHAFSSSYSSTRISALAACALKPSIRELGNGQGCDE